ncbi:MAG: hypothetical protein ACFFCS_06840 [Candidatus Hodarchaeota archaeon]
MAEFSVGRDTVAMFSHLLDKDIWTNLKFLSLLKEFADTNIPTYENDLTINVGFHVLPDFETLTEELLVILQIHHNVAYPHLFINREPLFTIPNLLLFRGYQNQWQAGAKDCTLGNDLCPRKDPQLYANMLFLLVHVARRMNDGFRGNSTDPRAVVSIMDESAFFDLTRSTGELLRGEGCSPDFNVQKPNIMQDIMGVKCGDITPDTMEQLTNMLAGMPVNQFLTGFLPCIKASHHVSSNIAVNDMMTISTSMAKVALNATPFYKSPAYQEAKYLIQEGFINPRLPVPHLPPKGLFLRNLLLQMGIKNMAAFANNKIKPLGLGVRTPISEVESMSGSVSWNPR